MRRGYGGARRGAAIVAAGVLVAVACSSGDRNGASESAGDAGVLDDPRWASIVTGPEESDAEPRSGGSIVVGLEAETNTYDPALFQSSQAGFNVAMALFDPLATRDAEGNLRPYLAESIESNEGFTEWTVRLRPGVTFHDGTSLDAQALVRNFEHLTTPGALTAGSAREIDRVEAVDELTARYVMARPNAHFPEILQLQIGWPFSPDAADRAGEAFGDQPVGTGSFRFVSWQRDGDLVVERNPDYWQEGQPYLDRITFRPIPDEATRTSSLASGDIDALQSSRLTSMIADVAGLSGVEVALGLGNGGGGVLFNTAEPPLDDLRVRQALAHSVDQEALIEVAAGDAAELTEPRTQFFPSDSPFYSEEVADAWIGYDPERARELYEEYVDDPGRSDGREVGEPVALQLDATNVAGVVEVATAYEGFYEETGFQVTVEPMEQATAISTAVAGDYQVKIFRMGTNGSPFNEFRLYFGDPAEVITNFTDFHDETTAEVTETLRTVEDEEEQAAQAERMGLHLAEQVPWQWTGSDLTFVAARSGVKGLRSWVFPDGTLGDGVVPGVALWGQVWADG